MKQALAVTAGFFGIVAAVFWFSAIAYPAADPWFEKILVASAYTIIFFVGFYFWIKDRRWEP